MSISVALFKRSRGRESSTSARSLIRRRAGGGSSLMARCRRAGGGSSLMARCNSRRRVAGRFLLPQLAPRREDRLSALSDDLLLLILRRVDGRAAFCAGTLSRRWAHLPRELTALDLKVGDTLPPRYHRMVRLYLDLYSKRQIALYQPLLPSLNRYERRAMRVFAGSVESFLEGPRRKVDRMNLEFFITGNAGCVNRLIAEVIDAWGVEDLEVIAKPIYKQPDVHTFPSHGLCKEPRASRLRSLKLAHCVPPPLHGYRALTVLVLRDIPASTTPSAAYEDIFTWCLQLNTVHLISCSIFKDVVVDAPGSEIRELVVDKCSFSCLRLRALPCLESIASIRSEVLFESTLFPCLRRWNLTNHFGVAQEPLRQLSRRLKLGLHKFFQYTPDITSLIIRFTGPDRWIVPSSSTSSLLPHLTRLLVADVPSSWDVAWPRLLLEMAPSLEVLHIHIAPNYGENPGEEISWQPTKLRLNRLKEFVVAGFQGTARQIYLVKFVVGVGTALHHVALFKNGHARDKGRWDWEMVTEQYSWTHEERDNMLKQIMDSSLASPVELVFG